MRRSRPASRHPALLEPLEPRTLLSGLTIITHGAELLSTARPGWLDAMAAAIRSRVGPDTAIYALRMEPSGGSIVATSFTRLAGPAPTTSSNDETILLLDWAAAASVNLLGLTASYSTAAVAAAVMPYLTAAYPAIGLTAPLVEGSIQLIGHSRGASLVSVLAQDLGQRGIWIDQVTTLDPAPVPPDPGVSLKSNVIFADNYWQNSGDGLLVPNGSAIAGAYNVGPLKLGGAYGSLDGGTHNDVHLFYDGTINTAPGASDGTAAVVTSWYPSNGVTNTLTGFYYSRLGGGAAARPASGIAAAFGGTAARGSLSHSGTQWANLATITLPFYTLASGQSFSATYRYGSYNTAANITWYLDPDTNPYNSNAIPISGTTTVSATGDTAVKTTAALLASAPNGTYYLEGRITNTTGTRYAYSSAITIVTPTPVGSIDTAGPATLSGWAAEFNAAALAIQVNVDGVAFYSGTAGLSRPDLVSYVGSANHGFAVDLTSLAPGIHRVDLYADDLTTGTPALIASRTLTTNQAPFGTIDTFSPGVLAGWAFDPNAGAAPIQIVYQIDSGAPATVTASSARPDLSSYLGSTAHGYAIALPQLTAGAHTATVWAVDSTSAALTLLGTRSLTVSSPAGNALPIGSVDILSTTTVSGWAYDSTTPASSINVRIDVDGVPGTPFLANLSRPDLQPYLGASNFGFTQALSLSPGAHRLDIYALDSTTATPVLLARRIVTPAAGPGAGAPIGWLDAATQTQLAGWAWSAALTGTTAFIRLDIDGFAGAALATTVLRSDINTYVGAAGTFGFSVTTPALAPGTHSVSLLYLDPLTLASTTLATKTFITT